MKIARAGRAEVFVFLSLNLQVREVFVAVAVIINPGFHIVVSVVSVVRKKFVGQIEFILSRTKSCVCRFFCIEHLYGRFP